MFYQLISRRTLKGYNRLDSLRTLGHTLQAYEGNNLADALIRLDFVTKRRAQVFVNLYADPQALETALFGITDEIIASL